SWGRATMRSEVVELRGHIIDSLLLPKVLDEVQARGGQFELVELSVGRRREDASFARIRVEAEDEEELEEILTRIQEHGAEVVSAEKPKALAIRAVAETMREVKAAGKKLLLVAGPAVVHTGAAPHVVRLIELGYVDVLFSGNALAVHDIERVFYGTALGVHLD